MGNQQGELYYLHIFPLNNNELDGYAENYEVFSCIFTNKIQYAMGLFVGIATLNNKENGRHFLT
jgi:hypothetical protein